MSRPVKSQIVRDAGWTHDGYERRDALILGAAMQVFPTKDSWDAKDEQKQADLHVETKKVAIEFEKLGQNGWYDPDVKNLASSFANLEDACYLWARNSLSDASKGRKKGWWRADGMWQRASHVCRSRAALQEAEPDEDDEIVSARETGYLGAQDHALPYGLTLVRRDDDGTNVSGRGVFSAGRNGDILTMENSA